MLKLRTLALAIMAFAGFVSAAGQANAQASLTAEPVSLTVANSFTLAQTTAMNFGTFVALADTAGANTATLTMDPGTGVIVAANNAPATFVLVSAVGASQGVYAISGAAPSTTLTVSTSALTDLTCGACSGSPPAIDLTSVTADDSSPTTSVTGDATVSFGAVLTTVAGGNQYTNGSYDGSFDIAVAY
jgi:hypothetical protein